MLSFKKKILTGPTCTENEKTTVGGLSVVSLWPTTRTEELISKRSKHKIFIHLQKY